MYVMKINLGFNFKDEQYGELFTALLKPFNSLKAVYSMTEYYQILPAIKDVADKWKEVDRNSFSEVFEGSNYIILRTPSSVLIEIFGHSITVNFGRDSRNLSQEIMGSLKETALDVTIRDENFNELYGPKAPAIVD